MSISNPSESTKLALFAIGAAGILYVGKIIFLENTIKNACLEWKKENIAHLNSNPITTGNYESLSDPVFQEYADKGDAITKKLFDALGINYVSGENQNNLPGIMEAAKKCYNAGVDFGGMKELKEFSKGLK